MTFEDSGKNIGRAISSLERMQAEITERLGLQTSPAKTSKDQSAVDQKALDSEVNKELSGLLENLSDPTMHRLRSVAVQQIASAIPQLAICGSPGEAQKVLELFLGRVLGNGRL